MCGMRHSFSKYTIHLLNCITDSAEADLESAANKAIPFIRHAESVNGRVFVHCISGKRPL
jgi:protein-tyrosine phosphatase